MGGSTPEIDYTKLDYTKIDYDNLSKKISSDESLVNQVQAYITENSSLFKGLEGPKGADGLNGKDGNVAWDVLTDTQRTEAVKKLMETHSEKLIQGVANNTTLINALSAQTRSQFGPYVITDPTGNALDAAQINSGGITAPPNNTDTQKWLYDPVAGKLKSKGTNQCLSLKNQYDANTMGLTMSDCGFTDSKVAFKGGHLEPIRNKEYDFCVGKGTIKRPNNMAVSMPPSTINTPETLVTWAKSTMGMDIPAPDASLPTSQYGQWLYNNKPAYLTSENAQMNDCSVPTKWKWTAAP